MDQAVLWLKEKYREFDIPVPEAHFVLGSLIGSALDEVSEKFSNWKKKGHIVFENVPGLKTVSAPSHKGSYEYFYDKKRNKSICFQSGRLHGYEGLTAQEVTQTVKIPRQAGTNYFVLSNISGGLKKELVPGSVVAVTDHINFTGQSPLTGLSKEANFYFLDMEKAYHSKMTRAIVEKNERNKIKCAFRCIYWCIRAAV